MQIFFSAFVIVIEKNLSSHVDFSLKRAREVFFRLKTFVNYGTVKHQPGAEGLRFEVFSLEGLFFRSQQSTYKTVIHIKM